MVNCLFPDKTLVLWEDPHHAPLELVPLDVLHKIEIVQQHVGAIGIMWRGLITLLMSSSFHVSLFFIIVIFRRFDI